MARSAPARRRGRPAGGQSLVTEDRVLQAALHAFATEGYNGISIRTLARHLDISHNLLHQKYGSKLDIWRAAVDTAFGSFSVMLTDTLTAPGGDLERLREFITQFVLHSADNPDLLRLVTVESSTPSERLDHLCRNYVEPVMELFGPLYRALVAAKVLRAAPPETLYFMITAGAGAMYSSEALTSRLFGPSALNPRHHERSARAAADIIIDGLRVVDT